MQSVWQCVGRRGGGGTAGREGERKNEEVERARAQSEFFIPPKLEPACPLLSRARAQPLQAQPTARTYMAICATRVAGLAR